MKQNEKLTKVILEGVIGERYGREFYFDITTPAEAIKALCSQIKGFKADYHKGHYQIFRKKVDHKTQITKANINFAVGGDDLIIAPLIAGSGSGEFLGFPVGPLDLLFPGGTFLYKQAERFLIPEPTYENTTRPDQKPSFAYNGPVNTSEQGLSIPLVYGQMRVGSIIVSAGIVSEEV